MVCMHIYKYDPHFPHFSKGKIMHTVPTTRETGFSVKNGFERHNAEWYT